MSRIDRRTRGDRVHLYYLSWSQDLSTVSRRAS